MRVYFISGLGADSRVFSKLQLPDSVEPVYLDWIKPERGESLVSYSNRMAERIDDTSPFSLIGLSLGGLISVEIAKKKAPSKTILISSIPTSDSFPDGLKFAGRLGLYKIVPISWIKSGSLVKRMFTSEPADAKELVKQMIIDSDPEFIFWALGAIVHWHNEWRPPHLTQIHGDRDEIFPIRKCHPDYVIHNGSHLMVVTKADQISKIIGNVLLAQE